MGSVEISWTSVRRWLVPGPAIALLLVCIGGVFFVPSEAETFGFIGLVLGMLTASALYLRRSRKLDSKERTVWRLIGVATALAGIGVAVVGVLTEMGFDLPAFGALDAFFLGGYFALIVALVQMARIEGGGREWLPTILDAAVGGIAVAVLIWTYFYQDLISSLQGEAWWETAIAASYPIFDVAVIVGLIIMIIRRSHFHLDYRLAFIALALSGQVVADVIYFTRGVGRTFAEAEPAWATLLAMALMFVIGAAIVDRSPEKREYPETDVPIWAMVWPYLFAISLIAVHVSTYKTLNPASDEVLVLDALLVVGILIIVRQLVAIRRNRDRVEKQRTELVASVSHELRTPLTAIVGYLDILDEAGETFPEDARREMISEASGQSKHMARLVSDLVMLARGVHRSLPVEIAEVSVGSVVSSALRNVDAGTTKITIDVDIDRQVRIDPVRVQQALTNLLTNAIRYGGGQGLLTARIDESDLVFEMHDNGSGVPTRYETAIWQRFERGANRLNASNPGLGIGLSIVDAIATSHGGSASYRRSELMGGACFTIVLPGCVVAEERSHTKVDAYI